MRLSFIHNRSNYHGISEKINMLPHLGTPGTWGIGSFRLPDFGITEAFSGGGPTFQNPQIRYSTPSTPSKATLGAATTNTGSYGPVNPSPSSSGQSYSGGGGGPVTVPTQNNSTQSNGPSFEDQLRSAYNANRSALEGILPTYDADFNNYQNTVNSNIDSAQKQADQQLSDLELRYGDSLKQQLQNSRDLRQRTQSTFSGLGSLDSSAFADELLKQEQSDKDNYALLDRNKNTDITGVQNTLGDYIKSQKSTLASYQNEIDRAKQGVRQAMANGDIQQAQTLANYYSQIQQQQQNLVLALAQAQASGVDVLGSLKKINGVDFNNQFGQNLSNSFNQAISRYQIPTAKPAGQGYIGSSSGLSDEQKRLLGLPAVGAVA